MSNAKEIADFTQLFPAPAGAEHLDARSSYGSLDFGRASEDGLPYLIVNMVATLDGQGRIGKDTDQLGDSGDAQLFAALRERVDCVMAGTSTIEIESYNAPARGDEVQERRAAAGLARRPVVATVTRSGRISTLAPLYSDPGISLRVFSERPVDLSNVAGDARQIEVVEPVDVLRALAEQDDVRSVLLEGGPHLNTPFFAAGVVDELFLTLAPTLTGSNPPFPIVAGLLSQPQELSLVSVMEGDDHLYLRYRVRR
jgi:5-amino-6-(5-phosphoribosylamino)uracil reductase